MSVRKEFVREGDVVRVSCERGGEERFSVSIGDERHSVSAHRLPDGRLAFDKDGVLHVAAVAPATGGALHVRVDGRTFTVRPHRGRGAGGAAAGGGMLTAPMTGSLVDVMVAVGDEVERGRTLALLSAMKMEHKIVADVDGTVAEVAGRPGEQVEQGQILVRIEPRETEG